MRKIELLEIKKKSAFKTTIYLMSIPMVLMMLIGLISTIVSAGMGEPAGLAFGVPYMIMPVVFILIYGLMSVLVALVYNVFAKRFGGLQVVVREDGPQQEFSPNDPN
ncbi:hypothetical protein [Paenibacillus gansuensis]|uniref:DUF3566 domain-containing protein n=1 Tax=Paenibacillus gansuensis TaxID=306542 RepID=A0ABW5PH93_9BACL